MKNLSVSEMQAFRATDGNDRMAEIEGGRYNYEVWATDSAFVVIAVSLVNIGYAEIHSGDNYVAALRVAVDELAQESSNRV